MHQTLLHRLGLLAGALLCLAVSLHAQDLAPAKETALRFLQTNPEQFNLSRQDVSDVRITDAYVSKHNSVTHVWVQQQHAGIPVYNGLFGLHVKPNGEVFHLGHRFVTDLSQQVNTILPSLGAARAVEIAVIHLGFSAAEMPGLKRKISDLSWVFEAGKVARAEIPVEICYDRTQLGQPRLAWKLFLDQANTSDMWTITVDAQTGAIITQINHTVYCKVGHIHRIGETCDEAPPAATQNSKPETQNSVNGLMDEAYRVFELPVESPAHGVRTLVVNPADPIASPFGWLDVNGQPGPEYTYTRGNNVRAYEDRANANPTAPAVSLHADGGPAYTFDFPYDPNVEPNDNLEAAIANLFYVNNKMHDIYYHYGFDEDAGNFQVNNYGKGGAANDAVRAEALDGDGENNANFATLADGSAPRMQMFLWSGQSGNIVTVNAPGSLAGTYYAQAAAFGGQITTTPITGEVVVTNDGTGTDNATMNCSPPVNSLQGKIALIDRGVCEFGRKMLNAQQAGAIGCIVCNYEDATLSMGAGAVGGQVTIPSVMMPKPICDQLRQYAGTELNISLVRPVASGPNLLDGSFDNGIISHEYGHGVSSRLTGGPSQSGCLGTPASEAISMGEGWSDFIALTNTVKPGDVAAQRRGVGTFVFRQPNDGAGVRRVPYTTDMSINPHTLATVAATSNATPHPIGEVWATVTWDMYWAFVEKYGYDADLSNTNSGNYRAVQLVVDGMKLQPCQPGFIDGRDAIILADFLNYDGVDTCIIMDVFARRGMGLYASQGASSISTNDAIESFDPIPTCIKELKISKTTTTPLINPGENAEFTIKIVNHKDETAEGVVVTDPLPAGLTFVSASNGGTDVGGVVTWNLGNMPTLQEITLTYTAKSDPAATSLLYYRDAMEEEGDRWATFPINDKGNNIFYLQPQTVQVGDQAWRVDALVTETDQVLYHYVPVAVNGVQPVLRFWNNYNTETAADAGFWKFKLKEKRSGVVFRAKKCSGMATRAAFSTARLLSRTSVGFPAIPMAGCNPTLT
ncbi:MAG: M36 family metallopeptidase [Lewinellaceae bacterium]|nr:M36 family metallopeptidase [Lewinellaceae bacterium]